MAEAVPQFLQEDVPMTATGDDNQDAKLEIVAELSSVYPHITKDELDYIVSENYPDMAALIESLDCYEADKGSSSDDDKKEETKGAMTRGHRGGRRRYDGIKNEKRRKTAAEREEKRLERLKRKEEKAKAKAQRLEEKRLRKEAKKKRKEEFRSIKDQYKNLPESVVNEASGHFGNDDKLKQFLENMSDEVARYEPMEVEQTKLPEVEYDHAPADQPSGPDTFARHHAGVMRVKEQIKELKKKEKAARKGDDIDAYREACRLRQEFEEARAEEEFKCIVGTLSEKHKDKNMDEYLDLHGLKGKEAQQVVSMQLAVIEQKLVNGVITPNTEEGHIFSIVTGKGESHGRRAVLKPLVERYLIREGFTYNELSNGAGFKVLI